MATPGYEPFSLLWDLFQQNGSPGHTKLTVEQRKTIGSLVGWVNEHRAHPEGSTRVERFKQKMLETNGKTLDPGNESIAQGILECLDDYQAYSPYTNPTHIPFGIYDHFKGGVYMIRDFSRWASGDGELVVEYLSMLFGTKNTRLASEWCQVVEWPDGKYRSRFVYRGPDLKTPEPSFKVPSPTDPAY